VQNCWTLAIYRANEQCVASNKINQLHVANDNTSHNTCSFHTIPLKPNTCWKRLELDIFQTAKCSAVSSVKIGLAGNLPMKSSSSFSLQLSRAGILNVVMAAIRWFSSAARKKCDHRFELSRPVSYAHQRNIFWIFFTTRCWAVSKRFGGCMNDSYAQRDLCRFRLQPL